MAQNVFPMISYEDANQAMDWLIRAFGFQEQVRLKDQLGRVVHGELQISGSTVMVASPTPEYEAPARHAEHCEAARQWLKVPYIIDGVLVLVEDVNAHFERAKAEGATILTEVEDSAPGRLYRASDLEGHRWMFMQKARTEEKQV